ncbi:glycosyl hydrolase family 61-domain-containing protein [Parachaetomium inaequale]|uniref:lytic cellulose monooxygenase (C4-dehydrogenating) n=1 Tax=Parachaetomium inaequale TaxID=2588326 RepID=A0AAN6P888_9PEZI|nr:glycosyl hydrolase family 61-domain-containing protein [Parachaetomium inaequale]
MRTHWVALLSVVLAPGALGHNVQGILLVNGTETPEWKYVLDVASMYWVYPGEYPPGYQGYKLDPIIGAANPNITCGRAAFDSAPQTETVDVLAGFEVGFRVSTDGNGNRNPAYNQYPVFWHPGPAQIYLSRAPNDDLQSYKGDGDWFKIAYAGPTDNQHWSLWPSVSDFNFTIPKTTPPGKYLMRIENFMPTASKYYLQFYINCAFVNIIGPGGGTPTEFVRFPGSYQDEDPGFLVPPNQDYLGGPVKPEGMRLMEYKAPGPAVWTG